MLLGKRPRHLIRRTTSMSGLTVDLTNVDHQEPPDAQYNPASTEAVVTNYDQNMNSLGMSSSSSSSNSNSGPYDERFLGTMMVSPRNLAGRSSVNNNSDDSGGYLETASFLRTCGLCRRRLVPGRDIYMYRGDTAFCSQECREKKMERDERKERAIAASKKEGSDASKRF